MSQIIDERVVEMRFDNKQFEVGAKETITTLDKLKQSLNLDESSKSFELLDKAANSVSLEGIAAGVEALQKRFSTFGIIGMRVIENITDSLMGLASKSINYVNDAIISGGLKRAQNIENAHFQLQALLKDEEAVQAVMDNAMASVDGTAYAYDEAAKAASQFAASGMRAGKEMEGALRAITGVAAMTNSEYEGISRIFTTVAGNGRLMGDQLLQLSSRGLNAAATIADYFREVQGQAQITESDIRKMVSDGKISFQIFAEAMDWAFGESAFRANETFTGALSNMRSALARIGAEFFSPLIEQNSDLVLLINTIRERINDVKKALTFDEQKSAISGLTKVTGIQTEALTEMFNTIKENGSVAIDDIKKLAKTGQINAFVALHRYINGVREGNIRATYSTTQAINELTDGMYINYTRVKKLVEDGEIDINIFRSAMEHAYGDQEALSRQFTSNVLDTAKKISEYLKTIDLTKPMETVYNGVGSIKNVFKGLYSVLKPVGKSLRDTFSFSMDDVVKLSERIESITSKMKLSEKGSKNLYDAFKGVFDIIKLLGDGFLAILNAIIPVEQPVTSLGSKILDLAGSLGRILSSFAEWVRTSPKILIAYESLSKAIEIISYWLSDFISNLGEFINKVKELPFIQRIISGITESFDLMNDVLNKVEIRFSSFKKVFEIFMSIIKAVGPIVISIVKGLGNAISFVTKSISETIGEGGFNSFIDLLNSGLLVGIGLGISKFIESLTTTVNKAGGLFSGINRNLLILKNTLLSFQAQLKANVLKTIAISIAILAGSLFVLSTIDSEKLGASIGVVTVLMGELFAMLTSFNKVLFNSKANTAKISVGLIGLSVSVFILAGALKKISTIDSDKLLNSLVGISTLLIEMTGVAIILSKYGGKIQTGAVGIIGFSAAIYILTSSIKKLGELDVDTLKKGLISIGVLMAELSGFMVAAKFGKFKTTQSIAIIGLSAALLILQKAVEGFGNVDTKVLITGITAIGGILAEISAFTLLSGESKHLISTAIGLTIISYALKMLEEPMEVFGSMSWEEIGKGLLTIGGALSAITIALRLMPKNTLLIGVSLLSISSALMVVGTVLTNMASMSWEEIGKGMVVLASSMTILSISMNLMKGTLGASAAMLVMATSLAIFTPVLKTLGNMSWEEIGKGLIFLAGAFTIIGIAGFILGPIVPSIIALSGAVFLLGAACTAVGIGIFAFSLGLTTLSASGIAAAASLVEIIKILVVGIFDAIKDSAESLADAVKTIILVICNVVTDCIPEIVRTILTVVSEILLALNEHGPTIVQELLKFIISIIDTLANDLPMVIQSVVNLFMQFFSGITEALKGIDTDILLEGITGIGLIAALMFALSGVAALAPQAMLGVLAIGAVIAEISIILAAIGAIAQIPGLKWLIEEGGELLNKIGTAIGGFVGGVVGGFIGGVSSQFPKIANDLSNFMVNIRPFLDGAEQINPAIMDGIQALAKTILLLTAADVIKGLTSWFTGGNGLSKFGEELEEFGPHFSKFAEDIGNINPDIISSCSNAALSLGEMASKLPGSGGLSAKIFGENDLSDFGKELALFGPYLSDYAKSVKDVNPEIVESSAKAAQVMSDMASTLPNSGGLSAKIFGENDLSDFGKELALFGPYLSDYATSISRINPDTVVASANAALALSELANKLPNTGGLVSWFTGDNDIGSFGKSLAEFGDSMNIYYQSISGINVIFLNNIINEINSLIDIVNKVSNINSSEIKNLPKLLKNIGIDSMDSFLESFEKSTENMSTSLIEIGQNVIQFIIDGINTKIPSAFTTIKNFCSNMIITARSALSNTALREVGQNAIQGLITGIIDKNVSLLGVIEDVVDSVLSIFNSKMSNSKFFEIGSYAAQGLADGIRSKITEIASAATLASSEAITSARRTLDEHSPSKVFEQIGEFVSIGLAEGILSKIKTIGDASEEASAASIKVMNDYIGSISKILDDNPDFEPTIRPVMDLSRVNEDFNRITEMFNEQFNLATYEKAKAASNSFDIRSNASDSMSGTNNESGVTNKFEFTQNNYSPKALSRVEIYRQTKNLFSSWKNEVESK